MAARHAFPFPFLLAPVLLAGMAAPASAQLFPTGQCGGILCGVIGGSQAPPAPPPPREPCGGGLLCDMAPNAMQRPVTASSPQAAPPSDPAPMPAPVVPAKTKKRHKKS